MGPRRRWWLHSAPILPQRRVRAGGWGPGDGGGRGARFRCAGEREPGPPQAHPGRYLPRAAASSWRDSASGSGGGACRSTLRPWSRPCRRGTTAWGCIRPRWGSRSGRRGRNLLDTWGCGRAPARRSSRSGGRSRADRRCSWWRSRRCRLICSSRRRPRRRGRTGRRARNQRGLSERTDCRMWLSCLCRPGPERRNRAAASRSLPDSDARRSARELYGIARAVRHAVTGAVQYEHSFDYCRVRKVTPP